MTKISGRTVVLTRPRRRSGAFQYAATIAPKQARPTALRELYMDAGSRIRRGVPETAPSSQS